MSVCQQAGQNYLLIKCNDIALACVRSRQTQCQIVGFRSRIDEIANGQIAGHLVDNFLSTMDHFVVQETIVG